MITLVNKLPCNLKLGKYLIEASSAIELAEDEAQQLLELYPGFLEKKIKTTKNKKKNVKNNNT
jgi:hypothetical protein